MVKPFYCVTAKTVFLIKPNKIHEIINGSAFYGFYGIDEDEKFIYLANRKPSEIIIINKKTERVLKRLSGSFGDLHQILKIGDNIYFTDTINNRIGAHNGEAVAYYNVAEEVGRDVNHINSIYLHNNLLYVMLPIFSDDYSKILICDMDRYCLVVDSILLPRSMYHDIMIIDGSLYTVDGAECCLTRYNLKTGNIKKTALCDPSEYFCRGLDFNGDNFLIGCSDKAPRSIRHTLKSKVLILDNKMNETGAVEFLGNGQMHQVKFKGYYGQVEL